MRKWLDVYGSAGIEVLAMMGKRHTACSFETKAAAVRAVADGGMTKSEAMDEYDLGKWLAEEQNLAALGMAVGIELELIETESSVGSFNVDIYAQESGTGRKVIIVNQLEDTNHDHLALLIDTLKGRTGIELYVDDDKEIGHHAIANSGIFEDRLGLTAAPFDAKKASGLRFYKAGHPIKGHQDAWPRYIEEQLGWALEMKKVIAEIGL